MILSAAGISDSIATPVEGAHFWFDPGNVDSYPGTGSTLFDISGNGNNATLVNSPFFVSGQGGYFTFDGSNDYIRSSNIYNSGNDVHTLEVWIRPTANDDCIWQEIGQTTPNTGYHFSGGQINTSGSDSVIKVGVWNGAGISNVTAGTSSYLDGWIQIVRTYDGTTLRSYINGVAGGTASVPNYDSPNPWYIAFGAADTVTTISGATAGYFAGNYGTIRYYRTALSEAEVLQNYEATKVLYIPSTILNLDATNTSSYSGSGTTWTDLSFPQYNSTLVNAPVFNVEGYFDFNGTDEYASIAHTAALKPTVEITIEQWLYADDWTAGTAGAYKTSVSCTQGGGYAHYIWDGVWKSYIRANGVYQIPTVDVSSLTGWHHFITTFDGRYTKLYLDGTLVDTEDIGTSGNAIQYSVNNSLLIGAEASSTTAPEGFYWDGKISTTLIYNKALSANEVQRRFNQTRSNYYVVQSFTSGTTAWVAPNDVYSTEYLVVAGGGGAGNGYDNAGGGGGGAGMVLTGTLAVVPGQSYQIVVGEGGAGGADLRQNLNGSAGSNSAFASVTALGGGGGGGSRSGGDPGTAQVGSVTAPTGGKGNGGGNDGDGGGGASGAGTAGGANPGTGGAGFVSTISGSSVTYGVGGNGGYNGGPVDGANGATNRGNGGVGGSSPSTNSASGGNGGSGIVILKYKPAAQIITNGLVVNLDAGNTYSYGRSGSVWINLVDNTEYTISNGSFDAGNGGSIVFNGTSTYVPIGEPLSSGTNYTLEAWVYADVVTSSRNILSSANNVLWNNGSTLSGGVGGSYSLVTSSSFPATVWKHVMLTFNDSTNTMRLYINGVQVSQNVSVTQSYIGETLRIGAHYAAGNPVSFWDGKIAQVRVYNVELSASNVFDNFNATRIIYGV